MTKGLHKSYPSYRIIDSTGIYYYNIAIREWRKALSPKVYVDIDDLKIPEVFL